METAAIIAAIVSGLSSLLSWSLKSKYEEAMERIKKLEASNETLQVRVAVGESQTKAVAETLSEIKVDLKAIREKLDSRP